MSTYKKVSTQDSLLKINVIVFLFLLYGVYVESGSTYISMLLTYLILLIVFYFLLKKILNNQFIKFEINYNRKLSVLISKKKSDLIKIYHVLIVFILVFIFCHYLYLNQIPIISAFNSIDYDWIVMLRYNITAKSNTFWLYTSSFILKAFLPIFLWISLDKKQNFIFWILFLVGSFYSVSLLQKSYILTFLLPVIIYSILKQKYLISIICISTIVLSTYSLIYATNPELRAKNVVVSNRQSEPAQEVKINLSENKYLKSVQLIYNRLILIPGKMVADWFKNVPSKKPFLNGCGYSFIAPLKGCKFREYSLELYPIIYPEFAIRGFSGTVNVASFMYDYVNFGVFGFFISAISIALIFNIVEFVFNTNYISLISLNSFYVLMLSSSSLSTLLFSGGWGLIIVLYTFINFNNSSHITNE